MKNFTKVLVWGVTLVIVGITYLSVAQGWGVKSIRNEMIARKYASTKGPYGYNNKKLADSASKQRTRIRAARRKRRQDSLKKIETKFNTTRDSLRTAGVDLNTYKSGRYLHVYGYRPPRSSSYSSGYSSSSSSYSSGYSSSGSFRSGSSRSFRGGSRRGGK